MIAHIAAELQALAGTCEVVPRDPVQGWEIDVWALSEDSLQALSEAYKRLLRPYPLQSILDELTKDGVDVSAVFFSEEGADAANLARVRRADMLELAAAASLLSKEGAPIETLVMPNVPKASTRQSSPGIDILAACLDPSGPPDELAPGELIYIGSVKHTVNQLSQLRTDLSKSVSEADLNIPYLTAQFRVYHGRLSGVLDGADRIFLFLKQRPILDPAHVRILAVGAIEATRWSDLETQLSSVYASSPGLRRLRVLLLKDIANLHQSVEK